MSVTNWEKNYDNLPLTPDEAVGMIQGQIRYILRDHTIQRARKMLMIEQFRNRSLAKLQTKQNYSDVRQCFTGLIKCLIQKKVLAEDEPEIMTSQLCLPISVWINLCDREPDREENAMALVKKHIRQFSRVYGK